MVLVTFGQDVRRTLQERPEFMVEMMAIDGASQEVSDDIREILPLDFPISSFDLNLEDMRRHDFRSGRGCAGRAAHPCRWRAADHD